MYLTTVTTSSSSSSGGGVDVEAAVESNTHFKTEIH